MPLWPLADAGRQESGGAVLSTSLLTSVTSSATANAVGNWVQLVAATTFDCSELQVSLGATGVSVSASNAQLLFDVGVGASGAEVPLISNVAAGGNPAFSAWRFPIYIPTGTRLSVRTRSAVASKAVTMGVSVSGGGVYGVDCGGRASTYGAVTAGSRGTVLTAPTLTNTEANWTVIDAATASPMRWMVVGLAMPNTATVAASNGLLDIGFGASGQEVVIVNDISYATTTAELLQTAFQLTFPCSVPAGSRLVARYRASATGTAAAPNVTITGID